MLASATSSSVAPNRRAASVWKSAQYLHRVAPEIGVVNGDLLDRLADAPLPRDARALGGRSGPPLASPKPDGRCDLLGESLELGLDARGADSVAPALGLREIVAELGDARLVGVTRTEIDHLAGVAEVDHALAAALGHDLERMHLSSGMTDQS